MARQYKPIEQHELEGTFRSDRHTGIGLTADTLLEIPKPPKNLPKEAKKEWNVVVQWLFSRGILSGTDLNLIAMYCNECATYWHCNKVIEKNGMMIELVDTRGNTKYVTRAEVSVRDKALKNSLALAVQFGYTPVARTRLNLVGAKTANEFAKFAKNKPTAKSSVSGVVKI